MEISCIHQIKVPGIPTPTNMEQCSAIHQPTVVNVHLLENKRGTYCVSLEKHHHHEHRHHIIANRGSAWRVCLGGGEIRFKYCLFCCRHFYVCHQCIHMEREEQERDQGEFGWYRTKHCRCFGRNCSSFCISWGVCNGFKVSFFTITGYQYVRMRVLCFLVFCCRVCVCC